MLLTVRFMPMRVSAGYNQRYDCSSASGSVCRRVVHSSVHVQLSAILPGRPRCNVSTADPDGSSCRYANLLRMLLTVRFMSMRAG
jgi:hypothetical protein